MSNLPFNYRKQRLPQMEAGVFCRNLSYLKSAQKSIALMKVSRKVCEKDHLIGFFAGKFGMIEREEKEVPYDGWETNEGCDWPDIDHPL